MARKVLIVDDSKLARIVIGKAIAALQPDWVRVEAGNAKDALALLDKGGIDVMILDFNMPGEDGLQLAENVRMRDPAMPIALATANIQDEIVMRARAAGVAFVAKPISEDGLRGFVSAAELKLRGTG